MRHIPRHTQLTSWTAALAAASGALISPGPAHATARLAHAALPHLTFPSCQARAFGTAQAPCCPNKNQPKEET